jgi:hypothetical protein
MSGRHHGGARGFCSACCHPGWQCCCGRQCRKEPKELLVTEAQDVRDPKRDAVIQRVMAMAAMGRQGAAEEASGGSAAAHLGAAAAQPSALAVGNLRAGMGKAFIGGGCCVHLSVEYAPTTPTVGARVLIVVDDSEGTLLGWGKQDQPGAGYQVKEGIVTTKPGADLTVVAINATARVRWCEIFSC